MAGVQLDDWRAQADRRLDLARLGRDEQRHAAAGFIELVDHRREMIVEAGRVEPALGGALLAPLGDDAGRVRLMRQSDRKHLLGRRHLEIQRQVDLVHEPVDVAVRDVPPVFAEVGGDAVGAGLCSHDRRSNRIGMVAAARVPDGRDVVDIDAEAEAIAQAEALLPGLIAGIAASSGGTASAE